MLDYTDCIPVIGVFLYLSNAIFGSVPSSAHFSSNIFRIPTYFSASPLLFGYLGLDATTVKFHSVANCSNSADEKGTLSAVSFKNSLS